jgi:hypothetical protein
MRREGAEIESLYHTFGVLLDLCMFVECCFLVFAFC